MTRVELSERGWVGLEEAACSREGRELKFGRSSLQNRKDRMEKFYEFQKSRAGETSGGNDCGG